MEEGKEEEKRPIKQTILSKQRERGERERAQQTAEFGGWKKRVPQRLDSIWEEQERDQMAIGQQKGHSAEYSKRCTHTATNLQQRHCGLCVTSPSPIPPLTLSALAWPNPLLSPCISAQNIVLIACQTWHWPLVVCPCLDRIKRGRRRSNTATIALIRDTFRGHALSAISEREKGPRDRKTAAAIASCNITTLRVM